MDTAHENEKAGEAGPGPRARRKGAGDGSSGASTDHTRVSPSLSERRAVENVESALSVFDRYLSIVTAPDRRRSGRLDRSGYILLSRLAESPLTIAELSEVMGLDVSTINRRTAALMGAGLIKRIPDPEGGIARRFRVTSRGEQTLKSEQEAHRRALSDLLAEWSTGDLSEFARLLDAFNHSIEKSAGIPGTPDLDRGSRLD